MTRVRFVVLALTLMVSVACGQAGITTPSPPTPPTPIKGSIAPIVTPNEVRVMVDLSATPKERDAEFVSVYVKFDPPENAMIAHSQTIAEWKKNGIYEIPIPGSPSGIAVLMEGKTDRWNGGGNPELALGYITSVRF